MLTWLRADLAGGSLVLSGRVDLMLGPPDRDPSAASRLVIDLKSGDARPEYVEDLRFYALLMCLRVGVRPTGWHRSSSTRGSGRPRT